MTKQIETDVDSLVNIFTNIPENELDKYVGKQCYLKFKGNDPKWGIELENGQTVLRSKGEEYECSPNIISNLPGDKPQLFNIEQTQRAWGHNEDGKYVSNCIKFRIYRADTHECTGLPASFDSVIIL